jgi:hypothetical protein
MSAQKIENIHRMTGKSLAGRKVEARCEIENRGGDRIPAGAIGVIRRKFNGLEVDFVNDCPHCKFGRRVTISRIHPGDLRLLRKDEA